MPRTEKRIVNDTRPSKGAPSTGAYPGRTRHALGGIAHMRVRENRRPRPADRVSAGAVLELRAICKDPVPERASRGRVPRATVTRSISGNLTERMPVHYDTVGAPSSGASIAKRT